MISNAYLFPGLKVRPVHSLVLPGLKVRPVHSLVLPGLKLRPVHFFGIAWPEGEACPVFGIAWPEVEACPFFGIAWPEGEACPVLMLHGHLFLGLPCFCPPSTVLCRIVFAKPELLVTWPYHFSFLLITIVNRSLCGPTAAVP